jgi:hypothetical protein
LHNGTTAGFFFSKNHDYGAFLPLKSAKILFKRITLLLTVYGRPMKFFFHQNPKLLDLGRQFGQINFGAFGLLLKQN